MLNSLLSELRSQGFCSCSNIFSHKVIGQLSLHFLDSYLSEHSLLFNQTPLSNYYSLEDPYPRSSEKLDAISSIIANNS